MLGRASVAVTGPLMTFNRHPLAPTLPPPEYDSPARVDHVDLTAAAPWIHQDGSRHMVHIPAMGCTHHQPRRGESVTIRNATELEPYRNPLRACPDVPIVGGSPALTSAVRWALHASDTVANLDRPPAMQNWPDVLGSTLPSVPDGMTRNLARHLTAMDRWPTTALELLSVATSQGRAGLTGVEPLDTAIGRIVLQGRAEPTIERIHAGELAALELATAPTVLVALELHYSRTGSLIDIARAATCLLWELYPAAAATYDDHVYVAALLPKPIADGLERPRTTRRTGQLFASTDGDGVPAAHLDTIARLAVRRRVARPQCTPRYGSRLLADVASVAAAIA